MTFSIKTTMAILNNGTLKHPCVTVRTRLREVSVFKKVLAPRQL